MLREIALDTETTGLDPVSGHRVVEIGCVELKNHVRTGRNFHVYLNPERDMPQEAYRIHGLSSDFLANKPKFAEVVTDFLAFLEDSPLVIHNAGFDLKFLNWELRLLGFSPFGKERSIIDTVQIARSKFPGAPASLDALCKRFSIDLSARTKHGALLDAELLSDVYLELMGGAQGALELASDAAKALMLAASGRTFKEPREHTPSDAEKAAHEEFLKKLKGALWTASA